MKYLKIFENKILDDILDKISANGEKELTSWEREYLASYGDVHKRNQLEEERGKKEDKEETKKSFGEYDPRKDDTDFYKEMGGAAGVGGDMDEFMKNMSDEEYKKNQIEIFWDKMTDDDINEFFDRFDVYGDYGTKTWPNIPDELKQKFVQFLIQKGYIEK